jgi:hypothetical protein
MLSLGYDAGTGQAFLAFANQRVEFPLVAGKSMGDNTLYIGGFVGFIDEVKIEAVLRAPAATP